MLVRDHNSEATAEGHVVVTQLCGFVCVWWKEKHEVVGESSKTNQRKLETKVAGGHDDQKNSNDSSLQIR